MDLASVKIACSNCHMRELCLPIGLNSEEMRKLDALVGERRHIELKGFLYRNGAMGSHCALPSGRTRSTRCGMVGVLDSRLPAAIVRRRVSSQRPDKRMNTNMVSESKYSSLPNGPLGSNAATVLTQKAMSMPSATGKSMLTRFCFVTRPCSQTTLPSPLAAFTRACKTPGCANREASTLESRRRSTCPAHECGSATPLNRGWVSHQCSLAS
jgi:hypothetical protein